MSETFNPDDMTYTVVDYLKCSDYIYDSALPARRRGRPA